jgi:hypothetical protein
MFSSTRNKQSKMSQAPRSFETSVTLYQLTPCTIPEDSNIYIQQDTHVTAFIYLATALHVSGVTITHLQEHKTTVSTASANRYTVLLSVAIVEEIELM